MEDWKNILFLVAASQGFLLSLALFLKPQKQNKANRFLGIIVLVVSMELLTAWQIRSGLLESGNLFPYWLIQSYLLIPPSLWLFCQYNRSNTIKRNYLILLFAPAVFEILTETAFYIYSLLTGAFINLLDFNLWYLLTEVVPILAMFYVLALEAQALLRNSHFGWNKGQKKLSSQYIRILLLLTTLIFITLFWAAGEFLQLNIYQYLNLILVVFLCGLGYAAYFDPKFFQLPIEDKAYFAYDDEEELRKMDLTIRNKLLYIQPRLSLKELAGELNLPQRYISYLINNYHSKNFHSFINSYRVEAVMTKIKDPAEAHKTLLGLALESGFNSKSSFNKVFKEHTGIAPSEFLPSEEKKVAI